MATAAEAASEEVVSLKLEAAEPPLSSVPMEKPSDVFDDKSVIAAPHEKVDDSEAVAVTDEFPEPLPKKSSKGTLDRHIALAKIEDENRLSFIEAWEESEKNKVENWNNWRRRKRIMQKKMRNKVALIHKQAEEKRAMVEARQGEEIFKADKMCAKFRATRHGPTKV